jgi:hypothetical protein
MKRQLFLLLMILTLATTGAVIAQDYQNPPAATNETEPVNGPDVDVDTGANAEGAVDVDVTREGDADTDATGIDEGGALGDEDTTTTGMAGDDDDLPATASGLPTVALLGLLAMAAAFAVRFLRA